MRKTKILRRVIGSILIIIIIVVIVLVPKSAQKEQQTTSNQPQPTKITSLTSEQKTQIVAILTKDTDHYLQLWKEGKEALTKTQTPEFTQFKQTENPANDNSYIMAMDQADTYYSQANLWISHCILGLMILNKLMLTWGSG